MLKLTPMVHAFVRGVLHAALAIAALMAHAQDVWPSRPIKIIVPVAAGGTVDIVARMLAQEMSQSLGQSVVVENRPSAASLVGTQLVAKAAPDGYTLLAHSSTFFTAPLVVTQAGYDPVRDFVPVDEAVKGADWSRFSALPAFEAAVGLPEGADEVVGCVGQVVAFRALEPHLDAVGEDVLAVHPAKGAVWREGDGTGARELAPVRRDSMRKRLPSV